MVPIREYAIAYGTSEGYLSSGVSTGYHLLRGGLSRISGAIISIVGAVQNLSRLTQPAPATPLRITERHIAPRNGISIRTVSDRQRSIDERQFYNGNQVLPAVQSSPG